MYSLHRPTTSPLYNTLEMSPVNNLWKWEKSYESSSCHLTITQKKLNAIIQELCKIEKPHVYSSGAMSPQKRKVMSDITNRLDNYQRSNVYAIELCHLRKHYHNLRVENILVGGMESKRRSQIRRWVRIGRSGRVAGRKLGERRWSSFSQKRAPWWEYVFVL